MDDFQKVVDENFDELLAKYFGIKIVNGECEEFYGKIKSLHWAAIQFGKVMALNAVADGLVTPEQLREEREKMKATGFGEG